MKYGFSFLIVVSLILIDLIIYLNIWNTNAVQNIKTMQKEIFRKLPFLHLFYFVPTSFQ